MTYPKPIWLELDPVPEELYGGACTSADPRIFFPTGTERPNAAKAICETCPLVRRCLAYAVDQPALLGVWGGTTYTDRKRLRRNRKDPR